ncbi:MAG: cupredoxin domain-containing protein [Pseudomonadota bacterium]|nr:cupredoxin domain-containing protein [Pseudomonadota bacterium]
MRLARLPSFAAACLAVTVLASGIDAFAAEAEFSLVIRDHRFVPAELRVPANTKVRLMIDNQDSTAEEFDSKDLKREKIIPGRSKGTVLIGPLKPGRYAFVGEFHEASAKGVVIVE